MAGGNFDGVGVVVGVGVGEKCFFIVLIIL